jgi:eukaryotic-like serine/threonine-protein kinase
MTDGHPLLPGETLAGKYRIERALGQGGMGVVMAARHLELDERVAIKFLLGDPPEGAVERFLREARAAAKVKGEHVCRVFDFGRLETGEPYIVMEHLEGVDLSNKLEREGPQPASLVVGWIVEVCDALAEAHALGIVHRDLKPANVFLARRPDGSSCAKVLDFGISKVPSTGTMTRSATMMGSPVYMSPEQMESSRDVDARSDIWSLGVVLYELLSGDAPFIGESMVQLAVQVREREPLAIDPRRAVPEGLHAVIGRCLAKKPADRFGSVGELAAALAPFAPPEVGALVARLTRRITPRMAASSGSTLAYAPTRPERPSDPELRAGSAPVAEAEPPSPISAPRVARVDRLRATFAPLESRMGDHEAPRRPRRLLAAALAVASVAALMVGLRLRSGWGPAQPEAPARDAVTSALLAPATVTTDLAVAATAADAGVGEEKVAALTVTAPASRPMQPSHSRARASASVAGAAPPAVPAVPAVVTGVPDDVPTKRAPAEGRKKRDLDRDDPY